MISILFSVKDYNKEIDPELKEAFIKFFTDLKLEEDDPIIYRVSFGKLMEKIDLSNRWVYKGTMTTPPCERFAYWNVIDDVYPIDQETIDLIKAKLIKTGVVNTSGKQGNVREIQRGINLDVAYI